MSEELRCMERIEECYQLAEKHYGKKLLRPKVTFSDRLTKTAGKAIRKNGVVGGEIRLSRPILNLQHEEFIKETPGHEAAHLIATAIYGIKARGHGTYWREVMELIKQPANVTHEFKTVKTKVTREFLYKNGRTLTIIRHNKLQRGKVDWYQWKDGSRAYKEDFIEEITPES